MIYIRNIDQLMNRKISRYFHAYEFRCKCGKCMMTFIHPFGLHLLDCVRELTGKPVTLTSGYRCQEHNRNESTENFGHHPKGMAWDLALPADEFERENFIQICEAVFPYTYHNCDLFIHCDIRGFETRIY